ncbi:MAG TPA: hypothetical protein VF112_04495 [Candidatus Dormibacteraeota bacterium]
MRNVFTRRRVAVGAAAAALLLGAGTVFAYWTTSGGTGTGSAAAGSSANVVVHQTGSAITGLAPATDNGDGTFTPESALSGDFDNLLNPGPIYVTSVTAAVTGVTPATGHTFAGNGKPDCATTDFAITGTSNTPGDIAHGSGVGSWSGLKVHMVDTGANQDNCQGASITITYTAH